MLPPREKLLQQGAQRLTEEELLAIVLGTGTPGEPVKVLASRLLHRFVSLRELSQATPAEISGLPGVGPAKAARILSALELGRRSHSQPAPERQSITKSEEIAQLARHRIGNPPQEHVLAFGLDSRSRLCGNTRVAQGSANSAWVTPADVFRPLLHQGAVFAVVVHNHPSGNCTPSPSDLELTHRLAHAGDILGIPLVDHIILGHHQHFSFREQGMLAPTDGSSVA